MIPLRLLPFMAIGAVALGTFTIINTLLDDQENLDRYDEQNLKQVKAKMKRINDELGRLVDIKMMNDKREATNQVSNAAITVDGVEINELIQKLEEELGRLVKLHAVMKNTDNGKERKKRN